jgi:hypothetical protein
MLTSSKWRAFRTSAMMLRLTGVGTIFCPCLNEQIVLQQIPKSSQGYI